MGTERNFGSDEKSRRSGYQHTAPKDNNFNPGYKELKGRMKANYESPGLRGESTRDRDDANAISDAVPRGK